MKQQQNRNRGNSGSKGQNFNPQEGRRAGQEPKTADRPSRRQANRQAMEEEVE